MTLLSIRELQKQLAAAQKQIAELQKREEAWRVSEDKRVAAEEAVKVLERKIESREDEIVVFVAGLSGPSQEQADRLHEQRRAKVIAATPRKPRSDR